MKRMPLQRVLTGRFATIMEKAAECIKCGDCEGRCPYHLPIMEIVEKHAKWYQEEKSMHHDIVSSA